MCAVVALLAGCQTLPFFGRKDPLPAPIDSVPSALAAIRSSRDPASRLDAFGYLGDPQLYRDDAKRRDEVAEILVLALAADNDPNARIAILRSLAHLGSPKSQPAIVKATSDADPAVRQVACRLLGESKDPSAIAPLQSVLASDTNLDVRLAAADALGHLPHRDAALALVQGLESPDVAVRFRSSQSLQRITGKDHAVDAAAWREEIQTTSFEELPRSNNWLRLF
jgi:HEAT repeat protein